MPLMSEPLSIASMIVSKVFRIFLAQRRSAQERSLTLAELVNVTVLDDYQRRSLRKELEIVTNTVSKRLDSFISQEWSGITDNERRAAVTSATESLSSVELTDELVFASDANAAILADKLFIAIHGERVVNDLGEPAGSLYSRMLKESCTLLTQLVVSLGPFANRGVVELLGRATSISRQVELILDRVPVTSLEAPMGTQHDADFKKRYLRTISQTQDDVELFGIDVNRYRPRADLSVAYISLSVQPNGSAEETEPLTDWSPVRDGHTDKTAARFSMSVEEAIATSDRTLMRGEAGSGKTTLLCWLAVTAARNTFERELTYWNGRVPFLIRLRRYVGKELPRPEHFVELIAEPIAGLMPPGWVHRVLSSGHGLLLVDGVDELPANERSKVRSWLEKLLKEFPRLAAVVTARPTAADEAWLNNSGFSEVTLNRMGPQQVKALICHWHRAIESAGNLPCLKEELPDYEQELLSKLNSTPHLQALATNPLLCAMLCALNLDRHKVVPQDRMSLYEAALQMLLERRDVERGVVADIIPLGHEEKLQLLQYLAWRLSINGATETDTSYALKLFGERLRLLGTNSIRPVDALHSLIRRSGVIREPIVGRIDFVHRTFQEYLTAREAAEQGDYGLLIVEAHHDSWQETIIMAAAHPNGPFRTKLLEGLLDRAKIEKPHARRLRIVAAACLDNKGPLDPALRARVEDSLASLLPPGDENEARSLVVAGSTVLRRAPRDLSSLSSLSVAAMVDLIGLIGGPAAIDLLATYATNHGEEVFGALFGLCHYFDPEYYVARVLSKAPAPLHPTMISDRAQVACARQLKGIETINRVQLFNVTDIGADLEGLQPVKHVWLNGTYSNINGLLKQAQSLRGLTLWTQTIEDFSPLRDLPELEEVRLGLDHVASVDFLGGLPRLTTLWLYGLDSIDDLSILTSLSELQSLRLSSSNGWIPSLQCASEISNLVSLQIVGSRPPGGFAEIGSVTQLTGLDVWRSDWLSDISSIPALSRLQYLRLESSSLTDISPASQLQSLNTVHLKCPNLKDLSPLKEIASLQRVVLDRQGESGEASKKYIKLARKQLNGSSAKLSVLGTAQGYRVIVAIHQASAA